MQHGKDKENPFSLLRSHNININSKQTDPYMCFQDLLQAHAQCLQISEMTEFLTTGPLSSN